MIIHRNTGNLRRLSFLRRNGLILRTGLHYEWSTHTKQCSRIQKCKSCEVNWLQYPNYNLHSVKVCNDQQWLFDHSELFIWCKDIYYAHKRDVWESIGKPCSCTQFIKSRIFYYNSRENPYQYYKTFVLCLITQ